MALPAVAELETVRLRGHRITLEADIGGGANARPVVLIHGGGQTRHAWRRVAAALIAEGYRAVAFDCRGHGGSEWSPDGVYSIDLFAEDLLEVLEQLPRGAALVGASMGGIASLLVASRHSELASALVLVDVTPQVNQEGADKITGFMRANLDGFASLDEAADTVARYLPHRPRPADHSGLMKNLRRREDGRLYWHWDPRLFGNNTEQQRQEMIDDLVRACAKVKVPTLLVRGTDSEIVTPEAARHFQTLIAGSEWVDVGGARHMVAGDNNDEFTEAIVEFLKRVAPPLERSSQETSIVA